MYPRDVRVQNPQEALIVEQAFAMDREMDASDATKRWQIQARDARWAESWRGIQRIIERARPTAVRAPRCLEQTGARWHIPNANRMAT